MDRQNIDRMERDIIGVARSRFGTDLVSLLVVGSYATYDFVLGYSDYDLLAFVTDQSRGRTNFTLDELSTTYSLDIKCSVRPMADLRNRILDNDLATRFIGNIGLLDLKLRARPLYGENVANAIPDINELLGRDLRSELQAEYLHATDADPQKNIFVREPKDWCNYIINMSGMLLLSKGLVSQKDRYPELLHIHHPNFKGVPSLEKALTFRRSLKILDLKERERTDFKNTLTLFLEEYRRYTFK